jgi:PadR family transcriptional regulator PadR
MPIDSLSQLRSGTIEFCVLALLRRRPMYGLELGLELAHAYGLLADDGGIYPLLSRLRRGGLVESVWSASAIGPRRRYHAITPQGREALGAFSDQWGSFRGAVDRVLCSG